MEKSVSTFKKALVLHNPGAGEGDTTKRQLLGLLKMAGFECSYSSTKEFHWENIDTANTDFLVLAGGDGTVRKVAEEALSRKLIEKKMPLGLLPLGTANNIARTLGLCADNEAIIAGWKQGSIKKFDVGVIKGMDEPTFFLESFGFGLFPQLMREMEKQKRNNIDDSRERIRTALLVLRELVAEGDAKKCELEIDGSDRSGEFLLMEVMNTRSIGPNLALAPDADPGDGELNVVVIPEEHRSGLLKYIDDQIEGRDVELSFPVFKAKHKIDVLWDGKHVHVDDEYYKVSKAKKINVELRPALLDFMLPALKR